MQSAICTLFEKHYHYGVGGLVNSLYAHGYRGTVWAGYRGELPFWAAPLRVENEVSIYDVAEDLQIRFVLLETSHHFTNYKPDFMLDLWEHYCPDVEKLYYLDPDIVLKSEWRFFEEWSDYGVALCEDVNSPMHHSHPVRTMWKNFYAPKGIALDHPVDLYVNGGFVGVDKKAIGFLTLWKQLQDLMAEAIGGLENAFIPSNRSYLFHKTDQDALNMSIMGTDLPVSIMGQEAMDIKYGGFTMSHALGSPKPWKKQFASAALRGNRPSLADRAYWQHVESPIPLFDKKALIGKQIDLKVGAFIGKLIR